MKKISNIILGLMFLAIACFYISMNAGFVEENAKMWDVLWIVFGCSLLQNSFLSKTYYSGCYGLAIIIMAGCRLLHIEQLLHGWNLVQMMVAATLLATAFTFLFPLKKNCKTEL